jgi:hypothetical protein
LEPLLIFDVRKRDIAVDHAPKPRIANKTRSSLAPLTVAAAVDGDDDDDDDDDADGAAAMLRLPLGDGVEGAIDDENGVTVADERHSNDVKR